jgi:hypothetical protein
MSPEYCDQYAIDLESVDKVLYATCAWQKAVEDTSALVKDVGEEGWEEGL